MPENHAAPFIDLSLSPFEAQPSKGSKEIRHQRQLGWRKALTYKPKRGLNSLGLPLHMVSSKRHERSRKIVVFLKAGPVQHRQDNSASLGTQTPMHSP
jgi:hypothetical protein